jgi:hypothetical protein
VIGHDAKKMRFRIIASEDNDSRRSDRRRQRGGRAGQDSSAPSLQMPPAGFEPALQP